MTHFDVLSYDSNHTGSPLLWLHYVKIKIGGTIGMVRINWRESFIRTIITPRTAPPFVVTTQLAVVGVGCRLDVRISDAHISDA